MKDAANVYDYKITVHESYLYQKGLDVFGEYIKKLGYIKQTSKGARRLIHKLLLNSLYGRTGMASGKDIIKVVTSDKVEQILVTHKVIDNFILTDKLEYIRYKCMPSRELCSQLGENVYDELMLKYDEKYIDVDSSPAIAAAVTAYARITMNPLKFIPGNQYYYGDTDSAFLDKPLPKYLIGNEIGQFKQEYSIINRALFISSKLYLLEIGDAIISKSRGYSGKLTGLDYLELYRGGVVHAINPR